MPAIGAANGLMQRRLAAINDLPIQEAERVFHWDRTGEQERINCVAGLRFTTTTLS